MTRIADSDRELRKQGVWVRQQTKAREQRRQRANHLLEVRCYPFTKYAVTVNPTAEADLTLVEAP